MSSIRNLILIGFSVCLVACQNNRTTNTSAATNPSGATQMNTTGIQTTLETSSLATESSTPPEPEKDYISGYNAYSYKKSIEPEIRTPLHFTHDDMNIYWQGRKLNYYSAKLADVEDFFAGQGKIQVGKGNNNTQEQTNFVDGFQITYNLTWDQITLIEIKIPEVTTEKGGRVGMTIDEIEGIYKVGFKVKGSKPTPDRITYCYLLPVINDPSRNRWADGFIENWFDGYIFDSMDGVDVTEILVRPSTFVDD